MNSKKNSNFVQTITFINLYLITLGCNGELQELSMPILLLAIDKLVCLGSFNTFLAHFLVCRVTEEV